MMCVRTCLCAILLLALVATCHGASVGDSFATHSRHQRAVNAFPGEEEDVSTVQYEEQEVVFELSGPGVYVDDVRPDTPYLTGFNSAVRADRIHEVSCVARNAYPAAEVTWTWDGSPVNGDLIVTENANGTFDVTNVLDFDVRSHHKGDVFVCYVTNKAMDDAGEIPWQIAATLEVTYAPVADVTDNGGTRANFAGEDVTLFCHVDANPEVTRSRWTRDFNDVREDGRIDIDSDWTQPYLRIESVAREDKGYYRCEAENEVGLTISEPILLNVLHKPLCREHAVERVAVAMETQGHVECHTEAYPNTEMVFSLSSDGGATWRYTDGVPYYEDDPNYAYAVFSYNVSSSDDYKKVECRAENGIGEMEEICVIQVTEPGPAEAPKICELRDLSSTSMKFECYEVFRGGSTAYYALQMALNGLFTDIFNTTTPYYTLLNLEPERTYAFRVCASNVEFWEDTACSDQFSFTTLNGTRAAAVEGSDNPNTVQGYVPFLAGGLILLVLLVATAVSIMCVFGVCSKEEEREPQEVTLSELAAQADRCHSIADANDVTGDDTPTVVYAQVNKSSRQSPASRHSRTSRGEPAAGAEHVEVDIADLEGIYDKADFIKRQSQASLAAAAVIQAADEQEEEQAAELAGNTLAAVALAAKTALQEESHGNSRRSSNASVRKSPSSSRRSSVVSKAESVRSARSERGKSGSRRESIVSNLEQRRDSSNHGSENEAFSAGEESDGK